MGVTARGRWANVDKAALDAAVELYRKGRPIAECCIAAGLGASRLDQEAFTRKVGRLGIRRPHHEAIKLYCKRVADEMRVAGKEPGPTASHRRATKRWMESAVAEGQCRTCGKPRERLRQRCDACQRVANITTLVRRYAKAGIALSRRHAEAMLRPKDGPWPRSKFRHAVARVASIEVDRPAAVARAFAAVGRSM